MAAELYVGKESMTFEFEGSPVFVGPNTVIRAGHPIMRGREDLFVPLVVHYEVEPPKPAKVTSPARKAATSD